MKLNILIDHINSVTTRILIKLHKMDVLIMTKNSEIHKNSSIFPKNCSKILYLGKASKITFLN